MKTGMKVAIWFILAVLAIGLVFGVIRFVGGWGNTAAEVVSPDNVKAQHEKIIGHYQAMIAAADNACTVQASGESEGNSKSPTLIEDPTLAYEATFRNIVADYNASMDNIFKAGIVAPPGYPSSVELSNLDTTDWCTVSEQIRSI